jgi:hypothetical protein
LFNYRSTTAQPLFLGGKMMFGFQKLEIYHLSKDIVKDNYRLVKKFPSEEKFALVQQMNRDSEIMV